MSASASKKKRKELEGQGISVKDAAVRNAHTKKNQTLRNVLLIVLVAVICAAAVLAVIKLVNRPSYDTSAAVVTVGEEKLTVPAYNYIYNMTASNFCSSYSYLVQSGTPFADQSNIFGEGTLEDYFKESTNSSLKEILNVVAKAKAENYQLSDEAKANIENSVNSIKSEAASYGYSSADKYLSVRFGEGCNLENYREYMTMVMTYTGFTQKLSEDYKPSAEQVHAAYQEDPSAYDLVTCTYATASAKSTTVETPATSDNEQSTESTEPTQVPTTYTDEAKAEAREKAEGYAQEMPEDAVTRTLSKNDLTNNINAEVAEWLFDEARKAGDTKVFASNDLGIYFYAVRFDGRDNNDYRLAKANIITIAKDKTEETPENSISNKKLDGLDGESGEGESKQEDQPKQKTAEEKRDELLAAIHDGMTDEEYSAAVSALGYTVGTNSITKTYSIQEILDFVYDADRKPGDLYTAYENDNAYYVVRFNSLEEKTYRDQLVESAMWTKYYSDISSANELTVDEELMKHANTNLISNASSNS